MLRGLSLSLSDSPTRCRALLSLKVDLKLRHLDFWASLHGQVPGLWDWDMGNECFLAFTTAHLPLAEQNRESWGMGGRGRGVPGSGARGSAEASRPPASPLPAPRARWVRQRRVSGSRAPSAESGSPLPSPTSPKAIGPPSD